MDLVLFRDAVLHVCRIVRVLRRPRGNLLLLGIGGSGRQSLVRLATFLGDMVIFQIEIGRRYDHAEFREGKRSWYTAMDIRAYLDLRRLMKLGGVSNREVVFLFVDTQIIDDAFLEDLNALLHTGEVPNLFRQEDLNEVGDRRWLLSLSRLMRVEFSRFVVSCRRVSLGKGWHRPISIQSNGSTIE